MPKEIDALLKEAKADPLVKEKAELDHLPEIKAGIRKIRSTVCCS